LLAQIVLMPISRTLEGEHWPTDSLAGLLVGGFWLLIGVQIYRAVTHRWPHLVPPDERGAAPQT
jgi:membrane-associated phospholipid phosphatase